MTREFIILPEFDKQWLKLGFTDSELRTLQEELTLNPQEGKVISGTGGLRKLRIAFRSQGKSGSARICYVDFVIAEKIYLIMVYAKSQKSGLSKGEKSEMKKLIRILEKEIGGEIDE